MIIRVKVQARSSQEKVEEMGVEEYKVWVQSAPADNQANKDVIDLLADFFNTSASNIRIVSGHKTSHKIIEVK